MSILDAAISHERISDLIRADISALDGITNIQVVTKWDTAGLEVRVTAES